MITATDARAMDANSEHLGVSVGSLMDNAGRSISDYLKKNHPDSKVVFVCGTGNNGGDGFAAALGMNPEKVKVALLKKPSSIRTDISRERYSVLECPIEMYTKESLEGFDVIVDCALGTGISGTVRDPYLSYIRDVNESDSIVISTDVPSGFGTDVMVKPDVTITFHDIKEGMESCDCGEIVVADIGIPPEAVELVGPGDMVRYPIPKNGSHKGNNGRLMVIGGGPYFGAPIMSSLSALRCGTDIVRIFTPASSYDIVAQSCPVFMVTSLPGKDLGTESVDMLLDESKNYDAVLIGPGLGRSQRTTDTVRKFISACKTPMVIDADAIPMAAGMTFDTPVVFTPHSREFSSIAGDSSPEIVASDMNAVILKKGSEDIITDGTRTRRNRTGNPSMTGAGTGDVLSGAVAGLLSKGMSAFDAACLGAFICGSAGDLSFSYKSYGSIATDIIDCIPDILREHLNGSD